MAHAIRAARGSALSCRGWVQEAALRMLQNNLDPEVAEKPAELVVYGGSGKAARDWPSFERICSTLRTLADDEAPLGQSAKRGGLRRRCAAPCSSASKATGHARSGAWSRDIWTRSRRRSTKRCAKRSGRWSAAKGARSEWWGTRLRSCRSSCAGE